MRDLISGLLLSTALIASPALAQAGPKGLELAKKFGAREGVLDIAISPDGKRIAVVIPRPVGGEAVTVVDLAGAAPPKLALTSKGITEQVAGCNWVSNERLLCKLWFTNGKGKDTEAFTRTVAINSDGSNPKVIGLTNAMQAVYKSYYGGDVIDYNAGADGTVLMMRQFVPNMGTGTLVGSKAEGIGVVRIDTLTGKEVTVEPAKITVERFIADGQGHVRVMGLQPSGTTGYAGDQISYRYRLAGGGDWQPLSQVKLEGTGLSSGFEPAAVDPALNVVYGFQNKDGFSALYKQALDGSGKGPELVLAKPGLEVDGLIRIGRSRRVVGVSYSTEIRSVDYFDPELAKLSTALRKALGGRNQLGIIDASSDESKLVIYSGSDQDPGRYMLFDKTTRQLGELLVQRPELKGVTLAVQKPITYTAADGTSVPAYLTLPPGSDGKNLPTIVMPHGGPAARDEWGFDWLSQYFAQRGFAVIQPNYRGSTGYGSAWYRKNGFQSWRTAIGDINDAARWLVEQGIAASDKLAIVGWSYGGYAALQSQVLDPTLYKAVVAVAPVTDLGQLRDESLNNYNYKLVSSFIGEGPHVAEGSPARHADLFKAPVLMFHGDRDLNVAVAEGRLMAARLKAAGKSVQYVEFPGLDHQLDDAAARTRLLSESDAFLRKAMGLPVD